MCRGQIHSPPIGGKHDRTRLFLPPFISLHEMISFPLKNKQDMTFNLVNTLLKIKVFCKSMNRVCNSEGESSRQVA